MSSLANPRLCISSAASITRAFCLLSAFAAEQSRPGPRDVPHRVQGGDGALFAKVIEAVKRDEG